MTGITFTIETAITAELTKRWFDRILIIRMMVRNMEGYTKAKSRYYGPKMDALVEDIKRLGNPIIWIDRRYYQVLMSISNSENGR